MMRIHLATLFVVLGLSVIGFNGCSKGQPTEEAGHADERGHGDEHADGDEHAHSDEGPHEGHIIELGSEEHHAELTHDEATHKVGIYLLGSDAKTAAPIEVESVTINVSADGQPSQYVLAAVPQPGEEGGKSSYFELVDETLCKIVCGESEAKSTQARLSLNIGGKPFVGMIETEAHEHDHGHGHADEHGHSHAGDDALVWREELDELGYHIALGHHGSKLHAGENVEPAIQITRDGQPVADAKVFNSLIAADSQSELAKEVPTVYEPPTGDEPAHYAQGALKIPSDASRLVIRFRIVLPEGNVERSIDVPVSVE